MIDTPTLSLRLFSPFRHHDYRVYLTHSPSGWSVSHYGNKFNQDRECLQLGQHLGEGTEFPAGIALAFSQAWADLSKGAEKSAIQRRLQDAIDKPIS